MSVDTAARRVVASGLPRQERLTMRGWTRALVLAVTMPVWFVFCFLASAVIMAWLFS